MLKSVDFYISTYITCSPSIKAEKIKCDKKTAFCILQFVFCHGEIMLARANICLVSPPQEGSCDVSFMEKIMSKSQTCIARRVCHRGDQSACRKKCLNHVHRTCHRN